MVYGSSSRDEKKETHSPYDGEDINIGGEDYQSSHDTFSAILAEDQAHDIKLRTMSWKKATALMFGEQVCL